MSENKKPRVIHVDKLIIHADDVIISPKGRIHDPWFSPPRHVESGEMEAEETHKDHHSEEKDGDENRRPFSWF
ncbi:hypothetical protein AT864_01766 [Anoxybacillus sp. P3H1B]|uniref:hypothetical protein n=1 Tax=Anoxybacillus sp. P3H1B TaxID=1769293 RepID=UPI000798AFA9|nr:hypothetical protein [Anoxybacillus sp. P3H1B]KXG10205.1 hypothetical protein AT864_01766 [Anoxybacillus sp. P3H1B]